MQNWIRRPAAAVIEITGEDAADFLQSQFSADLRVSDGQFREGLWLNHRARIEGESSLLKLGEERFLLVSRSTPSELLMAKLDRHIISEEVELQDLTAAMELVLLHGSKNDLSRLGLGFFDGCEGAFSLYQENCYALPFLGADLSSVMIFGGGEALEALSLKIEASGFSQWSESEYKRFRIEKGYCDMPTEVGPEETPAEAGLSGLCSLQKGCYLGQEVVNRQSRLERVVKGLERFRLTESSEDVSSISVGVSIYLNGQVVGSLRALTDEAPFFGLAMLKTKALEAEGCLRLGSESGMRLEVL